jgi:hypothetical protein
VSFQISLVNRILARVSTKQKKSTSIGNWSRPWYGETPSTRNERSGRTFTAPTGSSRELEDVADVQPLESLWF